MSLSTTGIWELRPGGNDYNSGYFNAAGSSPGTDYSQQDSPQVTIDGASVTATVHTSTSQINIVGATVSAAWNRNGIYFSGGTLTAGIYEIVAVDTVNNRLTLDRSAGTAGQTGTGRMGGAKLSLGEISRIMVSGGTQSVSGMLCFVKAGNYTFTSSSNSVAGGLWAGSTNNIGVIGYNSVRGDLNASIGDANRPVFDAGVLTGVTLLTSTSGSAFFANIVFDGNGNSTVNGTNSCCLYNCTVKRCVTGINNPSNSGRVAFCSVESCGTGFTGGSYCYCCAKSCTTVGFSAPVILCHCVGIDNAQDVTGTGLNAPIIGCTFKGSTGDAINNSQGAGNIWVNNLITGAAGDILDWATAANARQGIAVRLAIYSNTGSYEFTTTSELLGEIALSADPYTNAATNDLRPNSTTGGGASLRDVGMGVPGQTQNVDVGAVRHSDSGGSSGGKLTSSMKRYGQKSVS